MKKISCEYCSKKFHVKGIKNHQKHCKYKVEETVNYQTATATSDLQYQRELGRKEGREEVEKRYKNQCGEAQIKALQAAAQAVEAIAHMMGDFRI